MAGAQPAAIVLVVEDDRDIQETMIDVLEDEGFRVAAAGNGREALDYLARAAEPPKLILLDLMMPLMDGFQFREEQRRHPEWADIPVVVLTAHLQIRDLAQSLQADDYIRKPLQLDSLFGVVRRYCLGATTGAPR